MMSESVARSMGQNELDVIYAKIPRQDVEEFYSSYQQWALRQRVMELRDAIAGLRQQIEENAELMRQSQPSAVALATLARLQANGVSDIGLLDHMLERGETWLDATMQRLDYCEQLDDFLSDDYEQWCRHALEGAYDWIDSLRDEAAVAATLPTASTEETFTEATEELLLSKLTGHEEKDEDSLLETTLKRPAFTPVELQERSSEHSELAQSEQILTEDGEAVVFEEELDNEDSSVPTDTEHEQPGIQEYIAPEVAPAEEDKTAPDLEQPEEPAAYAETDVHEDNVTVVQAAGTEESAATSHEPSTQWEWSALPQVNASESQAGVQVDKPGRRPNFIWRLLAKIWGG